MTEPKRYRKLPVEITAIELTQYGDFVRAVKWVNDNGGRAVFSPAMQGSDDYLIIMTLEGNMEARVGWVIIQGVKGEFYPCEGEIFRLTYEAVEVPLAADALTGTGSYVSSRPDGATSLVGGAAKAVPL